MATIATTEEMVNSGGWIDKLVYEKRDMESVVANVRERDDFRFIEKNKIIKTKERSPEK